MDKQEHIVALIPVSEKARRGIPFTPYPDSGTIICPDCNERCWIGPEQQNKVNEGFLYACMECIFKDSEPGTIFNTLPLTDK